MNKVFFIAEIGLNHNGNLELAKIMVEAAKKSGANAVKFQSVKADKLISAKALLDSLDVVGMNDVKTVGDFWRKVSIGKDFHMKIAEYCRKVDIEFMSTPFDFDSVDILCECGVKRFKIASGDLTYYPLLENIANKGKPIILSTGTASVDEIRKAVDFIMQNGASDLTLLHCLSLYPTPPELANLNAITVLKSRFKLPVGFSDHTLGFHVPIAAIAKGATIVEKHFTIDNDLPGPDQKLSLNPDTFFKMVSYGNEISAAIKEEGKIVTDKEVGMCRGIRRSIVARKDLKEGAMLTMEDLDFKRPGDGISPEYYQEFIGKKLLKKKNEDEKIGWDDLK